MSSRSHSKRLRAPGTRRLWLMASFQPLLARLPNTSAHTLGCQYAQPMVTTSATIWPLKSMAKMRRTSMCRLSESMLVLVTPSISTVSASTGST